MTKLDVIIYTACVGYLGFMTGAFVMALKTPTVYNVVRMKERGV